MATSVPFNIREICRGCLSDNRDNLRSIFDSNILENFILCTNVQVVITECLQTKSNVDFNIKIFFLPISKVTDSDGLPKLICSSCVYKVISWVTFKSQCEKNDEILRATFQCSEQKLTIPSNNVAQNITTDTKIENYSLPLNNELIIEEPSEQISQIDSWITTDSKVLTDCDKLDDEVDEVYEDEV